MNLIHRPVTAPASGAGEQRLLLPNVGWRAYLAVGEALTVHLLHPDRTYRVVADSLTFPSLPVSGVAPFAQPSEAEDYLSRVRAFRAWVREQLGRTQP